MSRHRNFRNINYEDERDDDYDDESFHRISISADDDIPMSPGTARFMYHRPFPNANASHPIAPAPIARASAAEVRSYSQLENDVVVDAPHQFYLEEDSNDKEETESSRLPPSSNGTAASHVSDPEPSSAAIASLPAPKMSSRKAQCLRIPEVENLRLAETSEKKDVRGESPSRSSLPSNASYRRLSALAAAQATPTTSPKVRHRVKDAKPLINLVIVGHVDAGKSTLMGHLLYQLGRVDDRTIHKYQQESARSGKASFAYAWILDDTQEERQRGVTMDIARTSFETEHRKVLVLDAPGHKDFIPNMITGASQADAGLLVVNATRGEFETGFDQGGQTREHAMLLRSLGVSDLNVAVNKLDTIEWSKERYEEVCSVLRNFLSRQAGFPKVRFVPVSGLDGVNLVNSPPADHPLALWYTGPTLVQIIDEVSPPVRAEDRALRAVVNDVFRNTGTQLSLSAKIEAGHIEVGEKVFIMPNADPAIVKGVSGDDAYSSESGVYFAGDQVMLTLSAVANFEPDSVLPGQVICRGGKECLVPGKKFTVRLVVFNISIPIMKGSKLELFAHSVCEPCSVVRLLSVLNKASGEVLKKKPRCLTRNMSGVVELETERVVSLEPFSECRALGRLTLRAGGQTVAAGIIEQVHR